MFSYNTNKSDYIFFLKAGSCLLESTLTNLFKNYKINYTFNYGIPIASKEYGEKQKYLFVRNPIDRFFSSYYFFSINERMQINDYIKDFNVICEKEKDSGHFLSQFRCLTATGNIKDYFSTELGNYKIIRIEDIDNKVETFMKEKSESSDLYNELITFDFLDNELGKINIDFILLYTFFKTYYEKQKMHHKKINFLPEIDKHQYSEVYKLFKDEMLLYGYKKHDHTKFKKTLL